MYTCYGNGETSKCGITYPSYVTSKWEDVTCSDCIKHRPPLFKVGNRVWIKGTDRFDVVTDVYDNRKCGDPFLYEKSFYYRLGSGFYWSENAISLER